MRILDTDSVNRKVKESRNRHKSAKNSDGLELSSLKKNEFDGYIEISGQRTSTMGLHKLRKGLTIIPQNPFLLKGTLKENVDPRGLYSTKEIIDSLKKVKFFTTLKEEVFIENLAKKTTDSKANKSDTSQLKKGQLSLEDKLSFEIESSGSNLSLGQRQLICIARAIIKQPKILLMDEATASVDQKTDSIIQEVIAKELSRSTVITIAHRINTIVGFDRVLVMD